MKKMNKWFLGAFLLLASCTNPANEFVIEGSLPSNKYDGEWMYLVPMGPHTPADVDSVMITNGTFTLKGSEERMRVLRVRHRLRFYIQELLVVTEPGTIQVKADQVGSVTGTPQNDALQEWKTRRERNSTLLMNAYQQLKQASSADSIVWQNQLDSLREDERNYNFQFLMKQGNNTLGKFFDKQFRATLTEEQLKALDTKP